MKNSLIPTQRVDKHGRTVIRHMKSDPAPVDRKPIPSVALPVTSSRNAPMTDSEIAAAISRDGMVINEDTIHIMRDYDGGHGVDSASRFLITGNGTAKQMAADDFFHAANYVQSEQAQDSQGAELLGNVVSAWAAGSVLEETAMELEYPLTGNMRYRHYKMFQDVPSDDPAHWRGLAALELADPYNTSSLKDSQEFVKWAGQHNDIAQIVRFAVERETINVGLLRELMQQDITSPLVQGTL